MWIVRLALNRPYTFIVLALLILLASPVVIQRTPTDIFPNINIPVVAVAWQFTGLNPEEMEGRFTTGFERILTTVVDNIEHIESTTINGQSIIKIFLQPNASLAIANAQITAVSQVALRQLPAGAQPPLILNFSASTVPIIQLALSGEGLSEQQLNDLGLNFLRTQLVTVPGAAVPYPYGGKQTQVMIDLNPALLQSKGLSATDVVNAVNLQNLVLPSGTAKIGQFEYDVDLNGAPRTVRGTERPSDQAGGQLDDLSSGRRPRAQRLCAADQHRPPRWPARRARDRAQGGERVHTRRRQRHSRRFFRVSPPRCRPQLKIQPLADQSIFVRAAVSGVIREAVIAACLTGLMILIFLGSWRSTLIIAVSIPLSILTSRSSSSAFLGETINIMTLGGLALAVGMLVDDATVEIENINRNLDQGKEIKQAILDGASQIAVPALVSTLMHLHRVLADVLFERRRALSLRAAGRGGGLRHARVVFLVPNARAYAGAVSAQSERSPCGCFAQSLHPVSAIRSSAGLSVFASAYQRLLTTLVHRRFIFVPVFLLLCLSAWALVPWLGENFFPDTDSGQFILHVRAKTGTRIEETARLADLVEDSIRRVIPARGTGQHSRQHRACPTAPSITCTAPPA